MKKQYKFRTIHLMLILLTFHSTIILFTGQATIENTTRSVSWETSTPEEQGMDSRVLDF